MELLVSPVLQITRTSRFIEDRKCRLFAGPEPEEPVCGHSASPAGHCGGLLEDDRGL